MNLFTPLTAALSAVLAIAPAVTHGTDEGTYLVRDIGADLPEVLVLDATAVGDDLAFLGSRGEQRVALYWIASESGEQRKLAEVRMGDFSHELEALGDIVVFTGRTPRKDVEPWRSDGTRRGTRMLKDIWQGRVPSGCHGSGCPTLPAGSFPTEFVTIGDVAYFTAADRKHGRELWRTDGTRAGTRLVRDVRRGQESGLVGAPVAVDGRLYFAADDGRHGSELWRSDGTRSGTRMVTDIGPGWSVQWWDLPVAAGELIYFGAQTEDTGLELWRSDGTAAGTTLVKDIRPGADASKPVDLVAVGDLRG